jgi:hypothetical protein
MGNYESHWISTASLPRFKSISHDVKVDVVVIGGGTYWNHRCLSFKKIRRQGFWTAKIRGSICLP